MTLTRSVFMPSVWALAAGVPALITTPWQSLALTGQQVLTLIYLGAVASGLGFFLWNVGARKVNGGTLAVFNDLKIPLAVAVSFIFFGEKASLPHPLIRGGGGGGGGLFSEGGGPGGGGAKKG